METTVKDAIKKLAEAALKAHNPGNIYFNVLGVGCTCEVCKSALEMLNHKPE